MPAHSQLNTSSGTIWQADYFVNLMGCIDQYQICNPNRGNDSSACTKLLGQSTVLGELASSGYATGFSYHQIFTAMRILQNPATMAMYNAVEGRGGSSLTGWSTFLSTVTNALIFETCHPSLHPRPCTTI
jgi:hypothetical protein